MAGREDRSPGAGLCVVCCYRLPGRLGRLAAAPMSPVAPERLTVCEQLRPRGQDLLSEVLLVTGSSTTAKE
jgi:hypothetical protein